MRYVLALLLAAGLLVGLGNTSQALTTVTPSFCPGAISWNEASQYVGTQKSVEGRVANTNYASGSPGQPTFLNLVQPYPPPKFTVVILGRNRTNFTGAPEQTYRGRTICVTGLIETYRGIPQIEATAASQIVIYSPVTTPASNDPFGKPIPIIIGTLVWLLCFAGLIVFVRRR